MLDLALEHDLIQKSGSFFSYGETRLGQGRNNTKEFLRDNPELAARAARRKIYEKLGLGAEAGARPKPQEAEPSREAGAPRPRPSRRGAEAEPRSRAPRSQGRSRRRRLPSADDGEDAYELALKALSHKERTEAELAEWLRERGVEEAELAEVIAPADEAGAIDDERFARRYAEDKRELRGWGPDRIAEALRARRGARALIEAALGARGRGRRSGAGRRRCSASAA